VRRPRIRFLIGVLITAVAIFASRYSYRTDRLAVVRFESASGREAIELLSEPYTIDRVFHSMEGPSSHQHGVTLLATEKPELLWITAVRTEVVAAKGTSKSPSKFFCHANLMLEGPDHEPTLRSRVLTLVPGRLGIDLPEGYGIPVPSNQPLDFFSMALNRTPDEGVRQVRFRTRIEFRRDRTLQAPMQPLALHALYVTEQISGPAGTDPAAAQDGGCSEHSGETASSGGILEQFGKDRTIHWMVPPGTHEYRTSVTGQLALRADAEVVYATVHLHPFGRAVTLRDSTTGQNVLSLHQRESTDEGEPRIVEETATQPIRLLHGHDYELAAVYENTTATPVDAMAILYLYVLDEDFHRPT
jgi:hypothetical protein